MQIIAAGRIWPTFQESLQVLTTFTMVVFCWIFFRAENIRHAFGYISGIFSSSLFSLPEIRPKYIIVLIIIFMTIEWLGRQNNYAIENIGFRWKKPARYAFYYLLIIAIFWFGGQKQQFIYFQF